MMLEPSRCADVQERIEAYVCGELSGRDRDSIESHLLACPDCAAQAGLAERVAFELTALPAFDAPPELLARIKSIAGDQRVVGFPSPSRTRRFAALSRVTALAAMLLAALAVGWWQSRPSPPSSVEIAQAEREARYALAVIARLGRKATVELRDEVLLDRVAQPVYDGVTRSLAGAHSPAAPAPQRGLPI